MRSVRGFTLLTTLVVTLWLFGRPGYGQNAEPLLQIAFKPLVGDASSTLTAAVKNFSWTNMALVQVMASNNLTGETRTLSLEDGLLAVGPRRRANLSFSPGSAGFWTVRAQGSWLSGGSTVAEASLPIASAGSTTGEIEIGQAVEGMVRTEAQGNGWGVWAFQVQDGDLVAAELEWNQATVGSVFLALYDGRGSLLVQDVDFVATTTLQSGVYYLYILSDNQGFSYRLTLREGLRGDSEEGSLAFDATVSGLIEPAGDTDSWTFAAEAGDVALVTMRAPGNSNLDGELSLYDPNGFLLAASEDFGFSRDARVSYVIPATGEYRVEARSRSGNSSGIYRLRLTRGTCADAGTCLGFSPIQGFVPEHGSQAWQFQGLEGQEITIDVTALDQGFDPLLVLYDPDGGEIGSDDDSGGNLNPRLTVTLPADGFYTAHVSSYDGSSGRYSIQLIQGAQLRS